MADSPFRADDVGRLHARGVSIEEARSQLEVLSGGPRYADLVRPCTVGDGIVRLRRDAVEPLHEAHAAAARAGRFVKFVPASGAATRMFGSLLHFHSGPGRGTSWEDVRSRAAEGDAASADLVRLLDQLPRFAFHDDLAACLRQGGSGLARRVATGDYPPILEALLGSDGLGYGASPKGLVKFHRYADGASRTAFGEHLVEAADFVRDADGLCRLHFTIARAHRRGFEAAEHEAQRRLGEGLRFAIGYSNQKRSTDTLALDATGQPLRDAQGRLVFRPGGHGALIENLQDLEADLVFVKNIDNVQPDATKPVTSAWKRALAGYLVRLQDELFEHLDALQRPDPGSETIDRARRFARERLSIDLDGDPTPPTPQCARALLVNRFNRPLRVCGVVPNTGEPGGGPFWVRDAEGLKSLQIVETSQVDPESSVQQARLRGATHFNPVDLVCAVRDLERRPFDLRRFVDHGAVIVTSKPGPGGEIRVFERPGLWNGAMAQWNTVFVEVPITTFTPVKTVFDLLRPEHQAAGPV